jgi:hypothetical protein
MGLDDVGRSKQSKKYEFCQPASPDEHSSSVS